MDSNIFTNDASSILAIIAIAISIVAVCQPRRHDRQTKLNLLTNIAILITLAWIVVWGIFLFKDFVLRGTSIQLSEIGDFLGGVFAPVAFGWLILGYYLQRYELELQRLEITKNTKELEKIRRDDRREKQPVFTQDPVRENYRDIENRVVTVYVSVQGTAQHIRAEAKSLEENSLSQLIVEEYQDETFGTNTGLKIEIRLNNNEYLNKAISFTLLYVDIYGENMSRDFRLRTDNVLSPALIS